MDRYKVTLIDRQKIKNLLIKFVKQIESQMARYKVRWIDIKLP